MFLHQVGLFILLCSLNIRSTYSACQKSFVIICDKLSDVPYNPNRKTWTELLVQQKTYEDIAPEYTLTTQQLNRDLSNLKWLIINQQLTKIERNAFTYCKNLQQLILFGNELSIIKERTFLGFRNLMKLGLENNNIRVIEKQAFVLSKIDVVDLSHNKIQVLTTGLFKKCQVTTLSVTHNNLWKIDSNSLPKNLIFIHLDHNGLDSLPDELRNLNQLQELTVSHNNLYNVADLSQLRQLTKLDFSFNKISTVSQEFNNLEKLQHLDLSSNQLEKFSFTPQLIHNIKDHFYLLLAHNRLRNLDLHSVKNELTMTLSGNPWNCKCMDQMARIIKSNNITRTACDHSIFSSGLNPYCVIDDQQRCSEERVSESVLEEFKKGFRRNICDITETDIFVN